MTSAEQVKSVVEPVVRAAGCDLEDVDVRAAGRRQLVRVLVDADGGISLERVSEVSRAVSAAMDAADARLGFGAYVLEVSSPGVDRPLTLPRHFRRAVGRLAAVTTTDAGQFTGRIVVCDGDTVTFETDAGDLVVNVADIRSAKVQVEFNPRGPARTGAVAAREQADAVGETGLDADGSLDSDADLGDDADLDDEGAHDDADSYLDSDDVDADADADAAIDDEDAGRDADPVVESGPHAASLTDAKPTTKEG
ncbi:MAG: ribosome maturation factor RimP [Actinomycetales bacterium]|nr:ribosome maturation factor RimP [Actinomycetales bacterium]